MILNAYWQASRLAAAHRAACYRRRITGRRASGWRVTRWAFFRAVFGRCPKFRQLTAIDADEALVAGQSVLFPRFGATIAPK